MLTFIDKYHMWTENFFLKLAKFPVNMNLVILTNHFPQRIVRVIALFDEKSFVAFVCRNKLLSGTEWNSKFLETHGGCSFTYVQSEKLK